MATVKSRLLTMPRARMPSKKRELIWCGRYRICITDPPLRQTDTKNRTTSSE
jgi:hypothetical protein